MRKGITANEALLAVLVVALFGTAMLAMSLRMAAKNRVRSEVENMRALYVAWSLYEGSHAGPPRSLLDVRALAADDSRFSSDQDPFWSAAASAFPRDPVRFESDLVAPVRIGYSYAFHFPKLPLPQWELVRLSGQVGLIASPWGSDAKRSGDGFAATLNGGDLLRINFDGSATTRRLGARRLSDLANGQALFLEK